jgi:hypothetical protein
VRGVTEKGSWVGRVVLALAIVAALALPAAALAAHMSRGEAQRYGSQLQREICERESACYHARLGPCTRVTASKFRCKTVEVFGQRPNRRFCRYKAVVAKFDNETVRVRDGYNHCYNEAGELVAEGPVANVHPI